MKFYARNKYLVIQVIEDKKETNSGVYLPDDYVAEKQKQYKTAKILDAHRDGQFYFDVGCNIIFSDLLMEEFTINDQKITVIPEHVVYGVFREGPTYAID
jgi:co-chaperonin GroES (HSP10)